MKGKKGENIPIICGVTGLRNSLSRARFEYTFGSAREGIAVCMYVLVEGGRRGGVEGRERKVEECVVDGCAVAEKEREIEGERVRVRVVVVRTNVLLLMN